MMNTFFCAFIHSLVNLCVSFNRMRMLRMHKMEKRKKTIVRSVARLIWHHCNQIPNETKTTNSKLSLAARIRMAHIWCVSVVCVYRDAGCMRNSQTAIARIVPSEAHRRNISRAFRWIRGFCVQSQKSDARTCSENQTVFFLSRWTSDAPVVYTCSACCKSE